ncbi:MAG: hypothetical protein ABIJ92_04285 [Candidatus Aenigmatarchaeota archaeon]
MPIIGLAFTSFEANKKPKPIKGEIKVNSTPKIIGVKEVNIGTLNKKGMSVTFEFETKYAPDLADIKVGGEVIYLPKTLAIVMKAWKKDKKLPEEINIEILNHLFRRCLLKIAYMADDLQLPPPIGIPVLKPQGAGQANYIG